MRVLVVAAELGSRRELAAEFVERGHDVQTADCVERARRLAVVAPPTVALVHRELPGVIALIRDLGDDAIPVFVVGGSDLDSVIAACSDALA